MVDKWGYSQKKVAVHLVMHYSTVSKLPATQRFRPDRELRPVYLTALVELGSRARSCGVEFKVPVRDDDIKSKKV